MIKIVIEEFKNLSFYDVHVEDNSKNDLLETKQGLNFFEATKTINNFIKQYNLSGNDLITNNVYNSNEYLVESITETVNEYLEGGM